MILPTTCALVLLLAAIAYIDLKTQRIPDPLNAVMGLSGLAATWVLERDLAAALIGVFAGYGVIFLANQYFRRTRGRDGVGMGDAKLMAAAGAWLGWSGLPFVLLIASALGLAFVAAQYARGRAITAHHALAFGPFICTGVLVVWAAQLLA